jgi:hypothetical protein
VLNVVSSPSRGVAGVRGDAQQMGLLSKADYEQQLAELEQRRATLRTYFVQQQLLPREERKLNGIQYMQDDNKLVAALDRLEERWKITRYVASQQKGKGSKHTPQIEGFQIINGIKPRWEDVNYETYSKACTVQGQLVKVQGEGGKRRYQLFTERA